jgi:hypothetical protein
VRRLKVRDQALVLLVASFGGGVNHLKRCAYILFSRLFVPLRPACQSFLFLPHTYRSCGLLLLAFLYTLVSIAPSSNFDGCWHGPLTRRQDHQFVYHFSYFQPAFRLRKVPPDRLIP